MELSVMQHAVCMLYACRHVGMCKCNVCSVCIYKLCVVCNVCIACNVRIKVSTYVRMNICMYVAIHVVVSLVMLHHSRMDGWRACVPACLLALLPDCLLACWLAVPLAVGLACLLPPGSGFMSYQRDGGMDNLQAHQSYMGKV